MKKERLKIHAMNGDSSDDNSDEDDSAIPTMLNAIDSMKMLFKFNLNINQGHTP